MERYAHGQILGAEMVRLHPCSVVDIYANGFGPKFDNRLILRLIVCIILCFH